MRDQRPADEPVRDHREMAVRLRRGSLDDDPRARDAVVEHLPRLAVRRRVALGERIDVELGPLGIRVNAVCPGPIFTRFHERRAATAGKSFEEFRAEFGRGTMLGRPGTPAEVGACILFLASAESSYVTGTCLYVDGGQTAL